MFEMEAYDAHMCCVIQRLVHGFSLSLPVYPPSNGKKFSINSVNCREIVCSDAAIFCLGVTNEE